MQSRSGPSVTLILLLTAVALTAATGLATTVLSAPPTRDDLARIEARTRAREQDLETFRTQAAEARRDLAQLRRDLVKLAAEQTRSEQIANDSRRRLEDLNFRETGLTAKLGRNQNQLARLLGALQLYRRDPPPALLVHPNDAKDAVRAAILIRAVTPELEKRAKAFAAEAHEIALLRRETAAASEALFTAESDIADRRARIETLIQNKAELERTVNADAELADQDLKRLAARARSLRELLQGLPRQSATPERDGAANAGPSPDTKDLFGRTKGFVSPAAGTVIHRFGDNASRIGPSGSGRSEGWTWRTDKGASVRAPAQGTVEYAGPLKGWGVVLILRLGSGYHLVLAGLETTSAEAGRVLAAGEPVGRMNDQGGSDPELYMEIRRDGQPVDPARWLKSSGR